jgi:AraC family transcriptional regulator of adaptative response/methylated-DNA-[protein]-cysteine methyltransferase
VAADPRKILWAGGESDLGPFRLGITSAGICHLSFLAQSEGGDHPWVELVAQAIDQPWADHGLPLDPRGTDFQKAVWAALAAIPPGETRSYHEIACRLGRPKAARAVGAANAANPIAVLIPCHRLVRGTGALAGYAYGLDRKQSLLEKERNHIINRGA